MLLRRLARARWSVASRSFGPALQLLRARSLSGGGAAPTPSPAAAEPAAEPPATTPVPPPAQERGDQAPPPPPPAPGPAPRAPNQGPIGWLSVLMLTVVGSALVGFYQYRRQRRLKELEIKAVGRPGIGGPFSLVTHDGRPVTDVDFRGKYMFIYFGFTYCPDICPAEMIKMGKVMDDLKRANMADLVVPLMITLDPRRDTCQVLANYVKEYHPSIVGLTGTPQQVQDCCKKYRVYSSTGLTEEQLQETDDYLVDHTIFFYLMGPDGVLRQYYGKQMSAQEVSDAILASINAEFGEKSWWDTLWGSSNKGK